MRPEFQRSRAALRRQTAILVPILRTIPPPPRWLTLLWVVLLLSGIALAIWAGVSDRFPGDLAVGEWMQAHDPLGHAGVRFLRSAGETPLVLAQCLLASGWCLAWRRRWLALASLSSTGGLALSWSLKRIVGRPRTSVEYLEQITGFDSLSFPSGHAMGNTIVGILLVYLAMRGPGPRWVRMIGGGWGAAMLVLQPWAAVAAGVHWPSDVIGGVVWALVWMIPSVHLLRWARARDAAAAPPAAG